MSTGLRAIGVPMAMHRRSNGDAWAFHVAMRNRRIRNIELGIRLQSTSSRIRSMFVGKCIDEITCYK